MTPTILLLFLLVLITPGCQTVPPQTCPAPGKSVLPSAVPRPRGEILAENLSFDAKTGRFSYTLPEPALVRLRIGIRDGGPMLRTLIDWEDQGQGPQSIVWDKKDATGQIDLSDRQDDIMIVLSCVSLDPEERAHYEGLARGFQKSPGLTITFPDAVKDPASGLPVVRGSAPMRITVDEKDRAWLSETKFEVSIFVDTSFLMEDEEGTSPFNYQLRTEGFSNGVHVMTVNLVGYNGEIGTTSIKFQVQNP